MLRDLRYAIRWLMRSPGFTLVALLSLGLGVGVNAAMFSVVDSLLFRPLPVRNPATLVDVFTSSADGSAYATSSYPDFIDVQAQTAVFSEMTGYSPVFAPLALGERSRLVMGQVVTGNHFSMLGIAPHIGRLLTPADDTPSSERVVVLAHRMWQREFGGSPAALGQTLTLRGLSYTIVGVAPPGFSGVVPLLVPELWLPIAHVAEVEPVGITHVMPGPGRTPLEQRGYRWMFAKGRLKPGVTAAEARANTALVGRQLAEAHPQTNRDHAMSAVATSDVRLLVPQAGGPLALGSTAVMTVVGLVLLIACANLAGMLLARAAMRRREISVRLAIGASRTQLLRQLLCEGLVIGVLGSVAALGCAWLVLRALLAVPFPLPVQVVLDIGLNVRVIGFAIAAAAMSGLVASLLPAIKASAPSLVADLRGEIATAGVAGHRLALRDVLVTGQIALTAVLLVIAGLLLRSLGASQRADVGFDPTGLAMVSFDTDMVRYEPERGLRFWDDAVDRVRGLPGVTSAATAAPSLPFQFNFNQTELRVDSRTYAEGQRAESIENLAVSPDYLSTMGMRVIEGRDFSDVDRQGSPLVVLVNETMARTFWPGESAVGRLVTHATRGDRYRIVGVVSNHVAHSVLEAPLPFVYFAAAQQPRRYNHLLARTNGDAHQLLTAMRRELLAMEPGLVFMANETMSDAMTLSLMPTRVGAWLAAGFGALGTLLAAIGLYGVIAFAVGGRTREIGVRMALGARPGSVLGMVMRQGLGLAGIGVVLGALMAAGAATLMAGVIYGVSPFDPLAWGAALLTLLSAAAIANLIPARRAMRVDPMRALRTE
ncbi:MAG: ABC transporter permease [Acidobacteria bacterium]|nr:ABC transporter permease [Acidobacteriota bacterium]